MCLFFFSRTGNVGSLTVRSVKTEDNFSSVGAKVTGASPAKYTKMDFMTGDVVYVGSVPSNHSSVLKTSKFSGNLHQLWLNGQPIGLWNFNMSGSCSAAIEG